MEVIASRKIPIVNTRQLVWQPLTDNGDLSMRLAPIDWQPSGAHACIQMLSDDLWDAKVKLEKTMEDRDLWKSRYEHHKNERLEALNLNTMQASKIGYLMETIVKLEKKISNLEK